MKASKSKKKSKQNSAQSKNSHLSNSSPAIQQEHSQVESSQVSSQLSTTQKAIIQNTKISEERPTDFKGYGLSNPYLRAPLNNAFSMALVSVKQEELSDSSRKQQLFFGNPWDQTKSQKVVDQGEEDKSQSSKGHTQKATTSLKPQSLFVLPFKEANLGSAPSLSLNELRQNSFQQRLLNIANEELNSLEDSKNMTILQREAKINQFKNDMQELVFASAGIPNAAGDFRKLRLNSKLKCVDVTDVKKKIESFSKSDGTQFAESAPFLQSQNVRGSQRAGVQNVSKIHGRPAPSNIQKFRGMGAKPKSSSLIQQPIQNQFVTGSNVIQQQNSGDNLQTQNDLESRRTRNKLLREETFGAVKNESQFFSNEELKSGQLSSSKQNGSQTTAAETQPVGNHSSQGQSSSSSKSSTKQKQNYQPQPQTKPSVVQQLLNQAPQSNKVKKTKEQLKYEKYEQRQAAKQQQQQQLTNKVTSTNLCACCKGQLNQSSHTCSPSPQQVQDKSKLKQSARSVEIDIKVLKMGGKPFKEGDNLKRKNFILLNKIKIRPPIQKPLHSLTPKMYLTGTALDAIYMKVYYLGKSYLRSMNFFEQKLIKYYDEKNQYIDFNLYPEAQSGKTSEADSEGEEDDWEMRMYESLKREDLLRACKSIIEDVKLKTGNTFQDHQEGGEQKEQLAQLKQQFIDAIKESSTVRDAVNKKLQELHSDFRLPGNLPQKKNARKKEIWKDVVDQNEIRNIIKSIWNMSISTNNEDGTSQCNHSQYQEKSKVRNYLDEREQDVAQVQNYSALEKQNMTVQKWKRKDFNEQQKDNQTKSQSTDSNLSSKSDLDQMKINIKIMYMEQNLDQDLSEFSRTWLELQHDLEPAMLKYLQPKDSSVLFTPFTHTLKLIMGEEPSMEDVSQQYKGKQKQSILESLVDWLKQMMHLQYLSIQQVFLSATKRFLFLQNLEPVKNLRNMFKTDKNLAEEFKKYRQILKEMREAQPRFKGRSWLPQDWKIWKEELDGIIKDEIAQQTQIGMSFIQVPQFSDQQDDQVIEDPEILGARPLMAQQKKVSLVQKEKHKRKMIERELMSVQDLIPQGIDSKIILEDVAKNLDQIQRHQLEMDGQNCSFCMESRDQNCDDFILRHEPREFEYEGGIVELQIGTKIHTYMKLRAEFQGTKAFFFKSYANEDKALPHQLPQKQEQSDWPNQLSALDYKRQVGIDQLVEIGLIKTDEDGKKLTLDQYRNQIDKGFSQQTRKCSDCDKVLQDKSSCFILMQQNKVVCSKCVLNEIYTKTESCDYLVERVWTKVTNIMKLRQKINGAIRYQQIADWRKQNEGAEQIDEKKLAQIQQDYQAVAEGRETDEEKVQRINLFFDLLQIELEKLRRSALKQHVLTRSDVLLGVQPPNFESLRYQLILKNLGEKFKQLEETGKLVKQKLKQAHLQAQEQQNSQAKQDIAHIIQQFKESQAKSSEGVSQQHKQQQVQQNALSQYQQIINTNSDKKVPQPVVNGKGQSMSSYLGLDIGKNRVLPKPMQYERTDSTSRPKQNAQQTHAPIPAFNGDVKWPAVNQTPAEQLRQQMETFQKLILDQSKQEAKAASGGDVQNKASAEEQKLSAQLSNHISMITSTVQSLQAQSRDGKNPNHITSQISQTLDQLKYIQEEAQKIKGQYQSGNPFNAAAVSSLITQATQPVSKSAAKPIIEQDSSPNPMLFKFPSADLPLSRQAPPSDSAQPSSGHISGGVSATVTNPAQALSGVTTTIKKNKNKKKNNKKKASASKNQVAGNPSTQ